VDDQSGIAKFKKHLKDISLLEKMLDPSVDKRIKIEQIIFELDVMIQAESTVSRQRFQT
jgi:hypothetical protein